MITVRPLGPSDLSAVLGVQREAHPPALVEPPEAFVQRIGLFPRGALGAFVGGELAAYLFCHPWTLDTPALLHAPPSALPDRPTCLYVHDLAVRPRHRGRGLADRLAREAVAIADGMSLPLALVAVNGSEGFWERHGLVRRRQLSYGPGRSTYMVR